MPPEHGFDKTQEVWERDVFQSAWASGYFTTFNYKADGSAEKLQQVSFAEAVEYARERRRCLIYAVTANERWALVPREQWAQCLAFIHSGVWPVKPVGFPKVKRPCQYCGRTDGKLSQFGHVHAHPSCWRTHAMKK